MRSEILGRKARRGGGGRVGGSQVNGQGVLRTGVGGVLRGEAFCVGGRWRGRGAGTWDGS